MTSPQAEAKQISFDYVPREMEWKINVDYDHIRTALMNVLSNAVKYTPEAGKIAVEVTFNGGFVNNYLPGYRYWDQP